MTCLRQLLLLAVMTSCCATSGCDLTLGPRTETRYVIVRPGMPLLVLEEAEVRGRLLTDPDGQVVSQNIGGWVAMPQEHWQALVREIERTKGPQ